MQWRFFIYDATVTGPGEKREHQLPLEIIPKIFHSIITGIILGCVADSLYTYIYIYIPNLPSHCNMCVRGVCFWVWLPSQSRSHFTSWVINVSIKCTFFLHASTTPDTWNKCREMVKKNRINRNRFKSVNTIWIGRRWGGESRTREWRRKERPKLNSAMWKPIEMSWMCEAGDAIEYKERVFQISMRASRVAGDMWCLVICGT